MHYQTVHAITCHLVCLLHDVALSQTLLHAQCDGRWDRRPELVHVSPIDRLAEGGSDNVAPQSKELFGDGASAKIFVVEGCDEGGL